MLDWLGSFFVYRSPTGHENFLMMLPSRTLKMLAGTQTHYSKRKLVEIILTNQSH